MAGEASIKNTEFIPTFIDGLLKEGDTAQAREVVLSELKLTSEIDEILRLKNLLCKIERADKNHMAALRTHLEAYAVANLSDNHTLRARFHIGLATTYEELGENDKALIEYTAARFHYEEDGNRVEVGLIENNLAVLLSKLNRSDEAREHLDKARSYFSDSVKLAEIEVTAGEISLKENKSFEALASLTSSCAVFARTGNKKLLDQSIDALIKAAVDYKVTN